MGEAERTLEMKFGRQAEFSPRSNERNLQKLSGVIHQLPPSVDDFVDTATQNAAVSRNFDIFAACLTRYNLRRYNLRSRNTTVLVPANARCLPTLGDRAFQSAAPKLWNSLPAEIGNIQSLTSLSDLSKRAFKI